MNIIYKELSDGCPIIYGGNSGTGGHSFVFDGYDEDGLVSVNWGWEGVDDGYFTLKLSIPGDCTFNTWQDMVVGLEPRLTVTTIYRIWLLCVCPMTTA